MTQSATFTTNLQLGQLFLFRLASLGRLRQTLNLGFKLSPLFIKGNSLQVQTLNLFLVD